MLYPNYSRDGVWFGTRRKMRVWIINYEKRGGFWSDFELDHFNDFYIITKMVGTTEKSNELVHTPCKVQAMMEKHDAIVTASSGKRMLESLRVRLGDGDVRGKFLPHFRVVGFPE